MSLPVSVSTLAPPPSPRLSGGAIDSLIKENAIIRARIIELVRKQTLSAEESEEYKWLLQKVRANSAQVDRLIDSSSPQVTISGEDLLKGLQNYCRRPRTPTPEEIPMEPPPEPVVRKPSLWQRIKELIIGKQPEGNYQK